MTGPIIPSRLQATDPAEHQPPAPWLRFYVRFVSPDVHRRSDRSLSKLTSGELAWIARTVTAELRRRAKGGESSLPPRKR